MSDAVQSVSRPQFFPKLYVIVDLAIKHDNQIFVLAKHRWSPVDKSMIAAVYVRSDIPININPSPLALGGITRQSFFEDGSIDRSSASKWSIPAIPHITILNPPKLDLTPVILCSERSRAHLETKFSLRDQYALRP